MLRRPFLHRLTLFLGILVLFNAISLMSGVGVQPVAASTSAAVASVVGPAEPQVCQEDVADSVQWLNRYNLVVLDDVGSLGEVEGATFIGNNFTFGGTTNFGISGGLTCAEPGLTVVGSISSGNPLNVNTGDLQIGGTVTGGRIVNYNGGPGCGLVSDPSLSDATITSVVQQAAAYLAAVSANNADPVVNGSNNLVFEVANTNSAGLAVFDITTSQLFNSGAGGVIEFNNSANATLILINVAGTSGSWANGNMGNFLSSYSPNISKVVWNFHEATSLDFGSKRWAGATLAPFAAVTTSNNLEGSTVVKSLNSTGEVHLPVFGLTNEEPLTSICPPEAPPVSGRPAVIGLKTDARGAPIADWEFCVYKATQSPLAAGDKVQCATTDDKGKVEFAGLAKGDYLLCEVMQPGWIGLTPASPDLTFTDAGKTLVCEVVAVTTAPTTSGPLVSTAEFDQTGGGGGYNPNRYTIEYGGVIDKVWTYTVTRTAGQNQLSNWTLELDLCLNNVVPGSIDWNGPFSVGDIEVKGNTIKWDGVSGFGVAEVGTFSFELNDDYPAYGSLTATFKAGSNSGSTEILGPDCVPLPAPVAFSNGRAGIDIAKNAEGEDSQTILSGGTVTWTIKVTNTGDVVLNNVTIGDLLAPNCAAGNIGTLNPGQVHSYTCSASGVTQGFVNVATVTGTPPTGDDIEDEDPSTVEVEPTKPIKIVKQNEQGGTLSGWSFTVTNTATSQVVAGGTTTGAGEFLTGALPYGSYQVCETQQAGWLVNGGGSTCQNVTLNDASANPAVVTFVNRRAAVHPITECVIDNGDGTFNAYFGYRNDESSTIAIPVGENNQFSPAPQDRGQPTSFAPGRTPFWPNAALVVEDIPNHENLVWSLSGRTATAGAGGTPCAYHVFLDKEWVYYAAAQAGDVPGDLPANFSLVATSDLGTATCSYSAGVLNCVYANSVPAADNLGLWVPAANPTFAVQELNAAGWKLAQSSFTVPTDVTCNMDPDGSGTTHSALPKYCGVSLRNEEQPGTLIVEKITVPVEATEEFSFTVTADSTTLPGGAFDLGSGDRVTLTVAPGSYEVGETTKPEWNLTSVVCRELQSLPGQPQPVANPIPVEVGAGESWLCTFTNDFDEQPGITIKKYTNGEDADSETGPVVPVDSEVTWTYVVTNTGNVILASVVVTDSDIGAVTCPANTLAPGAGMTCTMTGSAILGQYANMGYVQGTSPQQVMVTAEDPSHYVGVAPDITHRKSFVNAIRQANGSWNVEYRIVVSNGGSAAGVYSLMDAPTFDDDMTVNGAGFISDVPSSHGALGVTLPWTLGTDVSLAAGASHVYTLIVNVTLDLDNGAGSDSYARCEPAGSGQPGQGLFNRATLTQPGKPSQTADACGDLPAIRVIKYTNGEDADSPTGPVVPVGSQVTWTYRVTNIGGVDLENLTLVDNIEGGITCPATTLAVGATMECTKTGSATTVGQYANTAVVTGTTPSGVLTPTVSVVDSNPSHYFGAQPGITIKKYTNGEDADSETGPLVPVGSQVTWTYVVTNTGNVILTSVVVTDSDIGAVTCPQNMLAPGAGMTCTMIGTAIAGQYGNVGYATGTPPVGSKPAAEDPSHYFGVLAGLGNRVWHDANANGLQEDGEVGVAGVTVKLYDSGSNLIKSTTTDANGIYTFTDLLPGGYVVEFVKPDGMAISPQHQGSDPALDSNADPVTGKSPAVTLVGGQFDTTIDAGMYTPAPLPAALGDRVWLDSNRNGLQDEGEVGVPGVQVTLYNQSGQPLATTTTGVNGIYGFTGLTPGSYFVGFAKPQGFVFTAYDVLDNGQDTADSDAQVPMLSLNVKTSVDEVALNDRLTYTLDYSNGDGQRAAVNVVISTTVPAGTTFLPGASTAGWACEGNATAAGTRCTLALPTLAANTQASALFVVQLGTEDIQVPDAINLAADIAQETPAHTVAVTLAGGDQNLSLDAGIYPADPMVAEIPRRPNPTNLDEVDQPQGPILLFLPAVQR